MSISVQFDKSRYAYLTETAELQSDKTNYLLAFDKAKKEFLSYASKLESVDEKARASHTEEKDAGLTDDEFEQWAAQNAPSYNQARQAVQAGAAQLHQYGLAAYEQQYQQQVEKGQNDLKKEAFSNFGGIPSFYLL